MRTRGFLLINTQGSLAAAINLNLKEPRSWGEEQTLVDWGHVFSQHLHVAPFLAASATMKSINRSDQIIRSERKSWIHREVQGDFAAEQPIA
jgi:hypothetical protein